MKMLVVNHPRGYYHHPLTSDTVAIGLWMMSVPIPPGFDLNERAAEYGVIGESECSCGIDTPHPIPDGCDDASV